MNGAGGAGQSVGRVRAGTSSLTRGMSRAERDKAAAYLCVTYHQEPRAWRSYKRLKLLARPTGFEPVTSAFGGQYLQFARGCRSVQQPVERPFIHDTLLADLCLCLISFA